MGLVKVGRQSLVTPIDWKRGQGDHVGHVDLERRQSLVTPIDWKPSRAAKHVPASQQSRRQSLVTRIDWKL